MRALALVLLVPGCHLTSNARLLCEVDVPLDRSDPCDCDAFLPLCADAEWVYDVRDLSNGTAMDPKAWSIAGRADRVTLTWDFPGVGPIEKILTNAWSYCRSDAEKVRHAWLSVDAAGGVWWEETAWYQEDGTMTQRRWDVPRSRRLDPARTEPDTIWTEEFDRYVVEDETVTVDAMQIDWTVMNPRADDLAAVRTAYGRDLLCHRAVEGPEGEGLSDTAEEEETKTFCFARGVGKVYEEELGVELESLAAWSIPGCPAD